MLVFVLCMLHNLHAEFKAFTNKMNNNKSKFDLFFFAKLVPVTASILLPQGKVFSVGSEISLFCNVTGEPQPEISWFKDNRPVEDTEHIQIPGNSLLSYY